MNLCNFNEIKNLMIQRSNINIVVEYYTNIYFFHVIFEMMDVKLFCNLFLRFYLQSKSLGKVFFVVCNNGRKSNLGQFERIDHTTRLGSLRLLCSWNA